MKKNRDSMAVLLIKRNKGKPPGQTLIEIFSQARFYRHLGDGSTLFEFKDKSQIRSEYGEFWCERL